MSELVESIKSKKSDRMLLLILLAVSLSLNVFQFHRASYNRANTGEIHDGMLLKSLVVAGVNGKPVTLSFKNQSHPSLLYIFSPSCHWCMKNYGAMQSLMGAERNSFREIGLSLSTKHLRTYLSDHSTGFPVYSVPSNAAAALGLIYTPETILVGSDGYVKRTWIGIYSGDNQNDIERYFDITLLGTARSHLHGGSSQLTDISPSSCLSCSK